MKILYFIPRYDPTLMGNRIHTEVIRCWRERGVKAEVLTLTAGIPQLRSEIQDGIVVHRLPVSAGLPSKLGNRLSGALLHYPYLAGALLHYRRFIATHHYDLVHIETTFPLGFVAALGATRNSPPLAVTLPGADVMSEPEYDYGYARFRSVQALIPFVFDRAAVLRADSPQIRDLAIRLGAIPDKVTAIPYNITEDSYPESGTNLATIRLHMRELIIKEHRLDSARPIVVSLSRLHPFKGVDYLVEALAQTQHAQPQALVVGPSRNTPRFGDYGSYLQRRASELGVAADVHLVGAVDHELTHRYLAAADIVVVPSVAESFNRVAVEAAAVGSPVVITETTGVSAYVREYGSGLVVPPKQGSAIAQAIDTLATDQQLWERCSRAGVPMAQRFRSQVIADELLRLYEGI